MELSDLYRDIILEHSRHPLHKGRLDEPITLQSSLDNPACGDEVVVWVRVGSSGMIEAASFDGVGCAISMAVASIMSEMLRGRTIAEAKDLANRFTAMVMSQSLPSDDLGELVAFTGVRQFPMRIKCATLPFHALLEGIRRLEGGA